MFLLYDLVNDIEGVFGTGRNFHWNSIVNQILLYLFPTENLFSKCIECR